MMSRRPYATLSQEANRQWGVVWVTLGIHLFILFTGYFFPWAMAGFLASMAAEWFFGALLVVLLAVVATWRDVNHARRSQPLSGIAIQALGIAGLAVAAWAMIMFWLPAVVDRTPTGIQVPLIALTVVPVIPLATLRIADRLAQRDDPTSGLDAST